MQRAELLPVVQIRKRPPTISRWTEVGWKGREGHVPLPSFAPLAPRLRLSRREGASLRAGGGVAEEVFE